MKLLADENFDNDILRGIRRRVAGFDVVRVQDVAEISGLDDPAVLSWATTNDRIVLTHDLHDDSSDAGTCEAVRMLFADSIRARLPSGQSGD